MVAVANLPVHPREKNKLELKCIRSALSSPKEMIDQKNRGEVCKLRACKMKI